jgi:hypothetical protein
LTRWAIGGTLKVEWICSNPDFSDEGIARMDFRTVPKQRVNILLPAVLDDRLRAARGRGSLSEVVASALCLMFDEDPGQFGLSPARRPVGLDPART